MNYSVYQMLGLQVAVGKNKWQRRRREQSAVAADRSLITLTDSNTLWLQRITPSNFLRLTVWSELIMQLYSIFP